MAKRNDTLHPDAPLLLPEHRRPRTRREFIAQSFTAGSGLVIASSLSGLFPSRANAALSQDLRNKIDSLNCTPTSGGGGTMMPFICFDLAGGANIAGSNVLVGYKGGQRDFLSTPGYSMLGLPSGMAPNAPGVPTTQLIDTSLGLAFHADSAFLRGIKMTCSPGAMEKVNGAVIPARSENDTGNNPHNPMYAIYRAGSRGDLVNLIGSQNSDSGGNSMAPPMLIDIKARPTQVTRPGDVTALVGSSSDVPDVLSNKNDLVAAMESVSRISDRAIDEAQGNYYLGGANQTERTSAECEIAKSADSTDKFGGNASPDPFQDQLINNATGAGPLPSIFPGNLSANSDGEFLKTASIMKLVIGGAASWPSKCYAAAGTITMGGFDYHTGDRSTGEMRDFRAGQCMGACLEYAHRRQTPLMLYVCSDGSVSSNGMVLPIGMDAGGRGKNTWDSDNQSTGAAFFLVYNPTVRLTAKQQQIGWMRTDGSVETSSSPGANSVTQLVDMVVLNYLALQSKQSLLSKALADRPESSILGGPSNWDKYTAF